MSFQKILHSATPPRQSSSERAAAPSAEKWGTAAAAIVLLLAGAGLFGATVHFHDSPRQAWDPAEPTSVPAVIAPVPAPSPAPAVSLDADPIAFLIQHPDACPRQVTLLVATQFEVFALGATKGQLQAPLGAKVTLLNVAPDYVDVGFGEGTKRIPLAATDLPMLAPEAIKAYEARRETRNKR